MSLERIPGIPHNALALWSELLAEELAPVHELYNEVMRYQALVDGRDERLTDVDSLIVNDLARVSLQLLQTIDLKTPEPTRRVIQAAVRYFLREDDVDADLDSVLGFDDDAEVMNAVLVHLGHRDWLIEVP